MVLRAINPRRGGVKALMQNSVGQEQLISKKGYAPILCGAGCSAPSVVFSSMTSASERQGILNI